MNYEEELIAEERFQHIKENNNWKLLIFRLYTRLELMHLLKEINECEEKLRNEEPCYIVDSIIAVTERLSKAAHIQKDMWSGAKDYDYIRRVFTCAINRVAK